MLGGGAGIGFGLLRRRKRHLSDPVSRKSAAQAAADLLTVYVVKN